jgi:hypothetical protein
VLRLDAVWRPAVAKHLLALSPDDRYGRFANPMMDSAVVAYSQSIDFAHDLCFATVESDGQLSGFLHLAVHGQVAELGASACSWQRSTMRRSAASAKSILPPATRWPGISAPGWGTRCWRGMVIRRSPPIPRQYKQHGHAAAF